MGTYLRVWLVFVVCLFPYFLTAPVPYGSSQTRNYIPATAVTYAVAVAMPDPLTHWTRDQTCASTVTLSHWSQIFYLLYARVDTPIRLFKALKFMTKYYFHIFNSIKFLSNKISFYLNHPSFWWIISRRWSQRQYKIILSDIRIFGNTM